MKKNKIITAAAIVFFLTGIANLIRIFFAWELTVKEWQIPVWVSFIGTIIPIFLSYNLLKLRE
jgi:tellurite resistance protein TehA-like permease